MPDKPHSAFVSKLLADADVQPDSDRGGWTEITPDPEEARRTRIVACIQDLLCQADEHSPLWEALSSAEDHAWAYLNAYSQKIKQGE